MDVGGDPPPPLPPNLDAFKRLISTCSKRKGGPYLRIFVKKFDIHSGELPTERTYRMTLNLAERRIIRKFTGFWPSPKAIDGRVQRKWRPLVTEGI